MAVSDLITDARAYTGALTTTAGNAMSDAISAVRAIGYTIPNYFPVVLPLAPPSSVILTPPTLNPVDLTLPDDPGAAPAFQDISAVEAGFLPDFSAVTPTINLPTKPNQIAEFLQTAPQIDTNIAFPDPPDALLNPLIPAPTLTDRVEPSSPTISLPGFDGVAPTDMPDAPIDYETRFRGAYADAAPSIIAMIDGYVDAQLLQLNPQFYTQMAAIERQLTTYLAGGTGLNPDVENAIYERERGKNTAEARRVRNASYEEAAKRGFTLPTGALSQIIQTARQGAADNNARQASEIVVMAAEMEQKNLQFAVTTSMALRQMVLSATLNYQSNLVSLNGQALDYAKNVLNAIIEVYNSAVRAFEVKLDAYKSEALVYDTRLKAALSFIELYRTQIEALRALTQVDIAKVDVYKARIEGLIAYSNVYRAQIEAVQGRVNLEKLQLDVFQSKVQAYTSLVQAKSAEWQGYSASIEGEVAKVKIYGVQVEAYNSLINGYRAKIEADTERVRAQALTNQARAANYASILSGYTAVVSARGEVARIKIEIGRQSLLAYTAQIQGTVANAQVLNEYYRSISTVAIANAQQRMTAQVETGNSTRAFGETIARLGTANASIFSGLAQAGLAGMNTLSAETLAQ